MLVEIRVALDRGEAGRDDLLTLEREAVTALQSVRALAYRIRRGTGEDALAGAREYGERLLGATGRLFRWIDNRANPRLAHKVARALAWSIREAITNAVEHGAAGTVDVRLVEAGGRIQVTIRDDGAGFVPQPIAPAADGTGLGLLGSSERMAEVGGIFTIRSRPGEGTVVSLEAPRYLKPRVSSPRLTSVSPAPTASVQLTLDPAKHSEAVAALAI
jgi:signal transduction histidine kinase